MGARSCPSRAPPATRWSPPANDELDLFDPEAVRNAVNGADAVLHLASRIRSLDTLDDPAAWRDNDRLRADGSAILVAAALAATASVFVQPTVAFVYPAEIAADEETPIGKVSPILVSALVAEHNALGFTRDGRRGVVLRLGLLDGPGTGHDKPVPALGATLHVADAARALLAALTCRRASTTLAATGSGSRTPASRAPRPGARSIDLTGRDDAGLSIATTLRANDPAALRSISGWAHDGMLLDGGIDYVPDDATVEIRFEQEPLDPNLALPAPELVRRSWWGTEYRMPFVLCRLTIRHATARPAMALDPASLVDVAWLAAAAVVRVDTAVGPIDVHTRSLDVRLEITDEVVSVRRRRVGRLIGWDATGGPL